MKRENHKVHIYFDMDGTLCEFRRVEHMDDLYKKGYFYNLKPFKKVVKAFEMLAKQGYDVKVLTCYLTDSPYAYDEKKRWIEDQMDQAAAVMVPNGENKALFIKQHRNQEIGSHDILIDDFNRNLKQWRADGGTSVKLINNINSPDSWDGDMIQYESEQLVEDICRIVNQIK